MIDVNEIEISLKSLEELHETLLNLHGRIIRIRYADKIRPSAAFDSHSRNRFGADRFYSQDVTGAVQGLNLKKSEMGIRASDTSTAVGLTVSLQGQETFVFRKIDRSHVSVFQEDSGVWRTIHQGSEYAELEDLIAKRALDFEKGNFE